MAIKKTDDPNFRDNNENPTPKSDAPPAVTPATPATPAITPTSPEAMATAAPVPPGATQAQLPVPSAMQQIEDARRTRMQEESIAPAVSDAHHGVSDAVQHALSSHQDLAATEADVTKRYDDAIRRLQNERDEAVRAVRARRTK
jgi:hypothetical protein